jgi:hypothetical protein
MDQNGNGGPSLSLSQLQALDERAGRRACRSVERTNERTTIFSLSKEAVGSERKGHEGHEGDGSLSPNYPNGPELAVTV